MGFMIPVQGAVAVDFFRYHGFREKHIGILKAIPMFMFALQFVGALWNNHLHRRKAAFMALLISGRLAFLGVLVLPLFVPGRQSAWLSWGMLGVVAVSAGLRMLGPPLWFPWMSDLIPHQILGRYWGRRQRWMLLTQVGVRVVLIVFTSVCEFMQVSPAVVFAVILPVAVASGVADILLFIRVPEPPHLNAPHRSAWSLLIEPLRSHQCRRFLLWNCTYMAAVMLAASFIHYYMLEFLGLSVWKVVLVFSVAGLGMAASADFWGRLLDRHGHRPVIIICSSLKPVIPLVFMLVTPATAVFVLPMFILFDSCLNAGNDIAKQGVMMKLGPRENRSMFIAAMMSFPALAAGGASLLGGAFLDTCREVQFPCCGRTWTAFHLLFLISSVLRMLSAVLARGLHEPRSSRSGVLLWNILGSGVGRALAWPLNVFYRGSDEDDTDTPE